VTLEDVIGLSGFNGYAITGPRLYSENLNGFEKGTLVKGPGSVSPQDVSLVVNIRAVIAFPIKDIKSIKVQRLTVFFSLNDGTIIEFVRQ
jgi:hypothetical protein